MKKLAIGISLLGMFAMEASAAFIVRHVRAAGADFNNYTEVAALWNAYPAGKFGAPDVPFGNITPGAETYNINVSVTRNLNEVNVGSGGGNFPGNQLPAGPGTGGDDWSVNAFAVLDLPAGDYTIGFGSDDGGFLRLEGVTFTATNNENAHNGVGSDTIIFHNNRGHNWTRAQFTVPVGGLENAKFESFFWERGGGDSFEIAIKNSHDFGAVNVGNGWALLADGVFGITVDGPGVVPEPSTSLSLLLGVGVVGFIRRLREEYLAKRWNS